jgi:alpha-ribazole phosphatase
MNVHLIRHAQTDYNLLGLCNDDPTRRVHLTDQGINQAQAAAQQLKDVAFQAIIVSELPRTRHTARIINAHREVPIRAHPDINDIRTGFDGQPSWKHVALTRANPMNAKARGGESRREHRRRVLSFLDWLGGLYLHTVLVVAHEETLRVCMALACRLSDSEMLALSADNCQLSTIILTRDKGAVRAKPSIGQRT